MSIRNLDAMFRPASVAVIGASDREGSLGRLVMRNLRAGGFPGPVWPVNPRREFVAGQRAWPTVAALPGVPDLAVLCTPAPTVPTLVAELGARGTRAAVVLSAGLGSTSAEGGPSLRQAMLEAARPHLLRILGPNCVGLLVPGQRLNASFAHTDARPGSLAFVSQSGALATGLLDWANARDLGFSHFVSLGDSADVDFGDLLDYLASDASTRAILMYVESIQAARKFMSAARAAARNKPVLVVKAGRAPEGARAAASHTGAIAGGDAVFDAAVRRAGMLRVDTLTELFDAAETLSRMKAPAGDRLAIITNGGGAGVLAADALALGGGRLAELGPVTLRALDEALPPTWSHGNPVDLIGDAPVARYTAALDAVLGDPGVDAVLFMHAPTAIVSSEAIAQAVLPRMRDAPRPVFTCWLGGAAVAQARSLTREAGIAGYDTPEQAVRAFLHRVTYQRNQQALMQTPPSVPTGPTPNRAAARAVLARALQAGRRLLDESEAKALLAAYGLPVVETRVAVDEAAAAQAARAIGFPVVLKILSPQISHKSDVGGVALGLRDADEVVRAAQAMRERVQRLRPDAVLAGYTVQAMVQRPRAHELLVGALSDPLFGPAIVFGQGGTAVEVVRDRAVALPPLNVALARDLIGRTRVSRLLAGYRDRAPVDQEALEAALMGVSQLLCEQPEVVELDINPLLADDQGVIALDARVVVAPAAGSAVERLAIRPYPVELEHRFDWGGQPMWLRPIRPEDEPALRAFYGQADPQDLRLRFFMARREVPHSELARYSQIDYDREMTFVAGPLGETAGEIWGEVRAVCDPDNRCAEFAIQVRSGLQGRGLGRYLLQRMIAYLRARGTRELVGHCLPENTAMSTLARQLGFRVDMAREPGAVWLTLPLQLH
ncbi:MAG: GNAT family N-acetyltransferase [Caldimonas sp.]|uniref:bifunctional acetate--CoA ligase family protein/GNAT family N-acetyltransferase n=1 Tax=Caldimonas sp. TaxID=2838790 RepID=UPI0039199647